MLDAIRLYIRFLGISVRSQMQYRASFIMMSLGHLMVTAIEFIGILVLFDRFGSLRGWRLPEVAFLYGLVNVSFAVADAAGRGFDLFANVVKTGEFDRLLLRPRSTALQLAGQELTLFRAGRLLQGLAILTWASLELQIAPSLPKVALFVATVAGSGCLFVGLVVIQLAGRYRDGCVVTPP